MIPMNTSSVVLAVALVVGVLLSRNAWLLIRARRAERRLFDARLELACALRGRSVWRARYERECRLSRGLQRMLAVETALHVAHTELAAFTGPRPTVEGDEP